MFSLVFLTILAVLMILGIGIPFAVSGFVGVYLTDRPIVAVIAAVLSFLLYIYMLALVWTHVITGWIAVIHSS